MILEHASHIATIAPAAIDTAFWNFTWSPDAKLQDLTRKIAFFLGVVWILFILGQHVIPSKRGGGGKIGIGKIVAVLFVIVLLCDLTLIPKVVNWIGTVAFQVAGLFGWI